MPHYTVTGRYQQVHQFRWTGTAASPLKAEQQVKSLLMGSSEGEDLSTAGLQLYGTYCALQQVKVREAAATRDTQPAPARSRGLTETDLHPLYLLHTAWRALSTQERRDFLTEMLTPTERRFLALGFEEEESWNSPS